MATKKATLDAAKPVAHPVERETSAAKKRISQADVPAYSMEQALRVPEAIINNYARKPTAPLKVAQALDLQPNAGPFRMLTGSAIAYGLIAGGAFAPQIEVTQLAIKILRPTVEGDDARGRREALLKPRVIGTFLNQYNGSPLPRKDIAKNVLIELGVPDDRADSVLQTILEGAKAVGFLQDIKGKEYVFLESEDGDFDEPSFFEDADSSNEQPTSFDDGHNPITKEIAAFRPSPSTAHNNRVFVTHGKNREFLDPIKRLIAYGKLEPVVSVDRPSVSKPVPDKVISEMRSCGSAIIHVDAEMVVKNEDGQDQIVLNPNVLIEIGAALALYGRRFILLVRQGVQLPSNLQGLFEVRYSGEKLDADTTLRLLEALSDVQNYIVPDRYREDPAGI